MAHKNHAVAARQALPAENVRVHIDESMLALLFCAGQMNVVAIPCDADMSIGNDNAALFLDDPSLDGVVARLCCKGSNVQLYSESPKTVVALNGVRIRGSCGIGSGDVISIGTSSIVFQRYPLRVGARSILDIGQFRQCLQQEIERSIRYLHPCAALLVQFEKDAPVDTRSVCEVADSVVRSVETIAFHRSNELWVLFPETSQDAEEPACRLLRGLQEFGLRARAGLALCPDDSIDTMGVLALARSAAAAASPGQVALAAQSVLRLEVGPQTVVAGDPRSKQLFEQLIELANADMPVLLGGETGVGKTLAAQALHHWSRRRKGPFVIANCGELAEAVLAGELYGYEPGSFVDAGTAKPGLFEKAQGGTLFFSEVNEASARLQSELLRVLASQSYRRVGAHRDQPLDVRIIASSHRNLEHEASAGRFRPDLFFRLRAASVHIPCLRERTLDIPLLARLFLRQECQRLGRIDAVLAVDAMQTLQAYAWPGNLLELRNNMEYLAMTSHDARITAAQLPDELHAHVAPPTLINTVDSTSALPVRQEPLGRRFRKLADEVKELERRRIREALEASNGVRIRAAELIGMPLRTFVAKMQSYHLGDIRNPRQRREKVTFNRS